MFKETLSGTGKHTMTITIETDHLVVMTKMLGLLKELDSYADAMKAPLEWGYNTTRRDEAAPAPVKARQPRKPRVQAVEQPAPVEQVEPFPAPTAPRKEYRRPTLTPIDVETFGEMIKKDSGLFWRWRDGAGKWMPELQQEIREFQAEGSPIPADQPAARKPYRKPTLTPIPARRFWAARTLTMPGAVPGFLRARFEAIAGGVS